MNNDRLSVLENFVKTDPDDPFNLYALGMEYKPENMAKSMEYFNHLLTRFPEYLPTYYQAAELMLDLNERDKAENILKKGILLAQKQANLNTLRELQNMLNNLYFEED